MNRIVLLFLLLLNFTYGNLTTNVSSKDLKVLKDLDINKAFLQDEDLNKIFKKYSRKSHLHYYVKNIKNSSNYISAIEEILDEKRLPSSLVFMPMAESNFKMKVTSSASAAGLWQFIPQTAKLFKLRNDKYVDERLDFIKSTNAATNYLKEHHDRFGNWYMAILAYNCGEGRIIEAITRAKLDKYIRENPSKANNANIIKYKQTINEYLKTKKGFYKVNRIYKKVSKLNVKLNATDLLKVDLKKERQYLPKESRIYLKKIVAFAMLGNRNFYQKNKLFNKSNNITVVKANGGLHLRTIAKNIKYSSSKLKKLNMHLKEDLLPNDVKFYTINIPTNKVSLFEKNISKIANLSFVTHKVKSGETLSSIGRKYKIRYGIIKDYNDMKNNSLKVNQKLIIPIEKKLKEKNYIVHKVKSGDTLSELASKYDIDSRKIIKRNDLKSSMISINQKLIIPIKNN